MRIGVEHIGGWRRILIYGALFALGVLLLEWIDYQRLVRARSSDIWLFLVAAGFLVLGIYLGGRQTSGRR